MTKAKTKPTPIEQDLEAIFSGARPAERTVPICFRPDLRARLQELERALQQAERERARSNALDAGGHSVEIAQQIEGLHDQMVAATVVFKLRRLRRGRVRELILLHPAQEGQAGDFDPDAFYPALVQECCYEPVLSDERWEWLFDPDTLSDAEYDALTTAAWLINEQDVMVPFSSTASRVLRASGQGSRRLNGSA